MLRLTDDGVSQSVYLAQAVHASAFSGALILPTLACVRSQSVRSEGILERRQPTLAELAASLVCVKS